MAAFNILDLGTGTGCLLISLLHEYPRARGLGLDISAAALRVAESNAVDLNVSDRARFAKGGWGRGDWANGLGQKFDVVVSNPPYIPDGEIEDLMPEVARFEPRAALAGGVDGLDAYRNIIAGLPECMKERGMIFFEVGAGQASAVTAILMENGFKIPGNRADSAGLARCIFAACQGK